MFSRDEFMSYVGSASGSSYAAGLKAIESIYGVDIDGEYAWEINAAICSRNLSRIKEVRNLIKQNLKDEVT